ncbi:hypothetical protein PHYSODRAFT_331664 [Phytophthora sojae]|uniref:DDE-1 domain-containing protein n=1 Tax=Phytophthora sojae (strain P6497) TaxID=1094619 RepID=G4ZJ71_PHYSP|nr:hypothetical protein PHYSODRAFT_331664 [Phytophthora sojae]EGZ17735.1 hypothetical protein PHYSODRAFT_331664 [Phytophthora sojae]|eukprot:XP_009526793.1 hypothetical protein PHYSODRAFT_331664 [Phytophthora sojae]
MLQCNATVPPGASLRPALVVFKDLQPENVHVMPESAACARASSRPVPAVREDDGHPLQVKGEPTWVNKDTNMRLDATVVVNGLGHGVVTGIGKIQQSVQDASKGEENTLITGDVEELLSKAIVSSARVAGVFSNSIQHVIEESGSLSFIKGALKYESVFNMDQTAIFIDMNGKTTIDFVGTPIVDIVQGSDVNGFRASVSLVASATGVKLPPLIVFAGIPGGPVSQSAWSPYFGSPRCEHTVQRKANCSEDVMREWIQRIWNSSVDGCKLLLLDSLKVHKVQSVRTMLEEERCTQVEFIPPGITGIAQPMDVAVMKSFKDHVRNCYLTFHVENDFPERPQQKRELLSRFVADAWNKV